MSFKFKQNRGLTAPGRVCASPSGLRFAVFAIQIWFVLLRTVPVLPAMAIVTSKEFTPRTSYWQFQPGERHGFRTPTAIPIAEGYKLTLQIDGTHESAEAGVSVLDADTFQVGTHVSIEYCKRGLPLLWKRIYVLKVSPIEIKAVSRAALRVQRSSLASTLVNIQSIKSIDAFGDKIIFGK